MANGDMAEDVHGYGQQDSNDRIQLPFALCLDTLLGQHRLDVIRRNDPADGLQHQFLAESAFRFDRTLFVSDEATPWLFEICSHKYATKRASVLI